MGTGVLSQGLKRGPGVTLTTHQSSAEVKNEQELYFFSPPSAFVACSWTALAFSPYYNVDVLEMYVQSNL
jgi:hypothetical protein